MYFYFNLSSNYSSKESIKTINLLKINVSTQNIINFTNDIAAYDNKEFFYKLSVMSNMITIIIKENYNTIISLSISHTNNNLKIIIIALRINNKNKKIKNSIDKQYYIEIILL